MYEKLLKTQTKEEQTLELEEIMMVLNSLRHDCCGTHSPKKAIGIIADKTKLPTERVREILEMAWENTRID